MRKENKPNMYQSTELELLWGEVRRIPPVINYHWKLWKARRADKKAGIYPED